MGLAELLRRFRAGEIGKEYYGGFFATDKRDYIFSLLNVAYNAQELGLAADYTKLYEEVFLETNRTLIAGYYTIWARERYCLNMLLNIHA